LGMAAYLLWLALALPINASTSSDEARRANQIEVPFPAEGFGGSSSDPGNNADNPLLAPGITEKKKNEMEEKLRKLGRDLDRLETDEQHYPIMTRASTQAQDNTKRPRIAPETKEMREADQALVQPIYRPKPATTENDGETSESSEDPLNLVHRDSIEEEAVDLTSPDTEDLEMVQGIWRYEPDPRLKKLSLGVAIVSPMVKGRKVTGTEPRERLGLYKHRPTGKLWMKGFMVNKQRSVPEVSIAWERGTGREKDRFWWKRTTELQHDNQMERFGAFRPHANASKELKQMSKLLMEAFVKGDIKSALKHAPSINGRHLYPQFMGNATRS